MKYRSADEVLIQHLLTSFPKPTRRERVKNISFNISVVSLCVTFLVKIFKSRVLLRAGNAKVP